MVKTLLKCVRGYKRETILSPIFMVLEVIFECMIPLVMSRLIDSIESSGSSLTMQPILVNGGILILLAVGSLLSGVMGGRFAPMASAGFAKNLRRDLFYKVQSFSFADVDKFSTSSLVTRLTTDVTNVQQAFQMCIRIAFRVPVMLVFSFAMSFALNKQLALIFLAIIPVLAIAIILILRYVFPFFKRIFKKYDALNNSVQENVGGIRVVKSFVREDYEKEKFAKASRDVRNDFTKAERIMALTSPVMMVCVYAATLLVCFFGAKMIINTGTYDAATGSVVNESGFSTGGLSAMLTYGVQMLSSLMMLSMVFVMITMSGESARRITEVLEQTSEIVSPENAVREIPDGSIRFENVNFKYSAKAEKFALSDIDLDIKSGETVGILGGTGASKTSLIQLIPRLYDTTEGAVYVGGRNVREYDLDVLRSEVAVVLQKNVLFSGTIKENLRWGDAGATDEELVRACKLAQADEFIRAFPDGYDTYIEQGGTNVSGGQKQRLCIARAILRKPKVMIFDDSTSAVDTKTDALIRRALAEELPEMTKIIIAQRVASVEHADKIVVMDGGKIVACGSHDELMREGGIYKEIYEAQTRGKDAAAESAEPAEPETGAADGRIETRKGGEL